MVKIKICAIEVGTNSTKFIVAEVYKNNSFEILERTSTISRLSKNMYSNNLIDEEPFENGIKIIGEFIERAREQKAKLVSVFSTSVLRDANNSGEFSRKVKELYGMGVDIISGEKEASLAFKACSRLADNEDEKFAVLDIGGGSTEITVGTGTGIHKKLSVDIGAVRLTEMFIKNDPAISKELDSMISYAASKLEQSGITDFKGIRLIGTGGTIKTCGTMCKNIDYSNEDKVDGVTLGFNDIEKIYGLVHRKSIEERTKLPGLNPKRADVITAGIAILVLVMQKICAPSLTVSSRGVIEGFIHNYLNEKSV